MTLERAEKIAVAIFATNEYRQVESCCATCEWSYPGYEGEIFCRLTDNDEWIVNSVEEWGVCNKYLPLTPREEKP